MDKTSGHFITRVRKHVPFCMSVLASMLLSRSGVIIVGKQRDHVEEFVAVFLS